MRKAATGFSNIKVTPIAAESFGVRSMCTLVETPDVSVLLDAGISLAPYRFSLPPHPVEFQTIARLRKAIAEAANKAQVTSISHFHFDHHTPSFEDWIVNWTQENETARQIYQNKTVLIKNPKENINASQRQRAFIFKKTGGKHAKTLETADGKNFRFERTSLSFSKAVAHGSEDSTLGWVIMATVVVGDERFMFAPDIQGPMSNNTLNLILDSKPSVVMLGGPPLYLEGFRVETAHLDQGLLNLARVVEAVPLTILEHHLLRESQWRDRMGSIFEESFKKGHKIVTAAEFMGKENQFLEAQRQQLYKDQPPSAEFCRWMKSLSKKVITKPPI